MASLLPSWWTPLNYSERLLDQHFGMGVMDADLHQKMFYQGFIFRPRTHEHVENSGVSEVEVNDEHFKATLDVRHFTLAELDVKVVGNIIELRGQHEEKSDRFGYVARNFLRNYMLPTGVDPGSVTSNLNDNGFITIRACKVTPEARHIDIREEPIDIDIQEEPTGTNKD